jgi:hypothetical protein
MLIVDNIGVAVVASIAKATVEAPSTADLAGTFGGTVNPAPVDGRFWDKATIEARLPKAPAMWAGLSCLRRGPSAGRRPELIELLTWFRLAREGRTITHSQVMEPGSTPISFSVLLSSCSSRRFLRGGTWTVAAATQSAASQN